LRETVLTLLYILLKQHWLAGEHQRSVTAAGADNLPLWSPTMLAKNRAEHLIILIIAVVN
jgi:hypothetical protein